MTALPVLLTCYAGFTHAFETDHLLAVSNLVTQRNKTMTAIKDGLFWGAGHSSTLLLVGVIVLSLRLSISENYFNYLEALVGIMLIVLGLYRFVKWWRSIKKMQVDHPHVHDHKELHYAAYSVGMMHGLAGSGSLLLVVMSQVNGWLQAITYLVLFGVGSMVGMMLVAGVFSLPYGKQSVYLKKGQHVFTLASIALCMVYGSFIVYEKLMIAQ